MLHTHFRSFFLMYFSCENFVRTLNVLLCSIMESTISYVKQITAYILHAHIHVPCMFINSNHGDIHVDVPFHLHLDLSFLWCFLLWAPEMLRRPLCHDYHCQIQTLHLILLKRITQHSLTLSPSIPPSLPIPLSLSFSNLSLTLVRLHMYMYLRISIFQHWIQALVAASPLESCCQNGSQMHCRDKMIASPD